MSSLITRILTKLLGRLPIGWLQIQHNRTRLIAAVGGVTFANVLIFMQLGFMGALFESSVKAHRSWNTDIVIASSDFRALREANPIPRARMLQALAVEGVRDATPIYFNPLVWTDPETGDSASFRIMGVDPDDPIFLDTELQPKLRSLLQMDTLLLDAGTRNLNPRIKQVLERGGTERVEMLGRQMTLVGLFQLGASFADDGMLITGTQTFLRLFPNRSPGTPTLIFITCEPGSDVGKIAADINRTLGENDARAFTKEEFVAEEQNYQASQTPIGFVFGFGVVMGLVVGLVIVYQVLSTDVQDHIAEYATFKAIGYSQRYFLGVVLEEAVALALLGFVPALLISLTLYRFAANATALPISMPWERPLLVSSFTLIMCVLSGALATRRLASADPAELF